MGEDVKQHADGEGEDPLRDAHERTGAMVDCYLVIEMPTFRLKPQGLGTGLSLVSPWSLVPPERRRRKIAKVGTIPVEEPTLQAAE